MPDVVDALQNDHVAHTRLSKDITIEARQRIHPKTDIDSRVVQKPVASNSLVQNSDGATGLRTSQALRKDVRPAAICIHCGLSAISNGIAKGHNRSAGSRSRYIETSQEYPGCDLHGI